MNFKVISTPHKPQANKSGCSHDCGCPSHTTVHRHSHDVQFQHTHMSNNVQKKVWDAIGKKIGSVTIQKKPLESIETALNASKRRLANSTSIDENRLKQRVKDIEKIQTHFQKSHCDYQFLGFVGWGKNCVTPELKPMQNISQYQGFLYVNNKGETCYQEIGSNLILFEGPTKTDTHHSHHHHSTPVLTKGGREFNINSQTGIDEHNHKLQIETTLGKSGMSLMENAQTILLTDEDDLASFAELESFQPIFNNVENMMENILCHEYSEIKPEDSQTASDLKKCLQIIIGFDDAYHAAIPKKGHAEHQAIGISWQNYFVGAGSPQKSNCDSAHKFSHALAEKYKHICKEKTEIPIPRYPDKSAADVDKLIKKILEIQQEYETNFRKLYEKYIGIEG